ncbi:TetR family transcriptional regulator [Brevibacterium marinum]|uniref:AcrR family transcriptional regulator n=1 Tax=Brevibacterium marinum TaxID=418643 RepID=A0A846RTD0_9MICO|nr:TetR family transcriptional regulator [Brevibacterium marinum]NJC57354.1 AcrR family transcriptional regulator [Brevibacterium marinum]
MALTAESITTTALDILSRYGLGDLSMRRLARELEVQPSALYWHVKDKQELFVLLATRMNAVVDARCPSTSDPVAAVMALREILLTYRDGAEIMLLGYSIAPERVTPAALSVSVLGASASHGIMAHVLGAVTIEQNRSAFGIAAVGPGERLAEITAKLLEV